MMTDVEFFKYQAKLFLQDTKLYLADFEKPNNDFSISPKYKAFNDDLFLYFEVDYLKHPITLMNAQHFVAEMAGFRKWGDLIKASPDELKPEEAFEINASSDTQEQYVLLPANKKYIRVELVYVSKNTGEVLAFSPVIEIPQAPEYLNELQPGKNDSFSDIENLSGIKKDLMEQYKNHRHSFS